MTNNKILIIIFCAIICSLIGIKLLQKNSSSLTSSVENFDDKIIQENQEFINKAKAWVEDINDVNVDSYTTKAWEIWDSYMQWARQQKDLLTQKPTLVNKINEKWLDLLYALGISLHDDTNELRKERKVTVIAFIEKYISKDELINYLKDKPNINQDALQRLKEENKNKNFKKINLTDYFDKSIY